MDRQMFRQTNIQTDVKTDNLTVRRTEI